MTKLAQTFSFLSSICQELMDEEEKEIHEEIENHINTSYTYATLPKAFLLKRLSQRRNKND